MTISDRLPTRWLRLIAPLVLAVIAAPLLAQDDGGDGEGAARPIPWPIKLGLRARMVDAVYPLVDRVVLVPDDLTYLHELSRWSPTGRWPVLYEDDWLAPMFIRAFKPAQVIRRPAVTSGAPADVKSRMRVGRSRNAALLWSRA